MHERIKELIFETDEWLESNAQSDRWEREIKFAELIVQECSRVIVNGGYWSGGPLGPKRQCTPPEIAQMVKEHFSVSEPLPRLDTMFAINPHAPIPCVLTNISEGIEPNRNLFGKPFTVDSRNKK